MVVAAHHRVFFEITTTVLHYFFCRPISLLERRVNGCCDFSSMRMNMWTPPFDPRPAAGPSSWIKPLAIYIPGRPFFINKMDDLGIYIFFIMVALYVPIRRAHRLFIYCNRLLPPFSPCLLGPSAHGSIGSRLDNSSKPSSQNTRPAVTITYYIWR